MLLQDVERWMALCIVRDGLAVIDRLIRQCFECARYRRESRVEVRVVARPEVALGLRS